MPNSCDSKPFQARMVPSLTPCFSVCFVSYSTPRVKVCSHEIQLQVLLLTLVGTERSLPCMCDVWTVRIKPLKTGQFLQPVLRRSLPRTKSFSSHFQVSCLRMEQAIAIAVRSNPRHACWQAGWSQREMSWLAALSGKRRFSWASALV